LSLAAALTLLTGCNNPEPDINLVGVENVVFDNPASVHGNVTVENNGRRDITIKSARLEVNYRNRELGSAHLTSPITLPGRATTEARFDIAFEDFSLTSLNIILTRFASNPDAFTINGEMRIKWGCFIKKIDLKNVSVEQLIKKVYTFAP
jgi:hypothetical protein